MSSDQGIFRRGAIVKCYETYCGNEAVSRKIKVYRRYKSGCRAAASETQVAPPSEANARPTKMARRTEKLRGHGRVQAVLPIAHSHRTLPGHEAGVVANAQTPACASANKKPCLERQVHRPGKTGLPVPVVSPLNLATRKQVRPISVFARHA